jgi:parallel beta-helix repeat protein
MFGWSEPARALSCGDTLGPSDALEVLSENLECEESPALIIEGPVVVDLRRHTIVCALNGNGEMTGTGIEVTGSQVEIRNGKVKNCRRGVLVKGEGHHLVKRLTVRSSPGVGGSEPIGFYVQSNQNTFIRNIVRKYAGEGFRLGVDEKVTADFNLLKYNQVIKNGDHGFRVRAGQGNVFRRNESKENEGEGFRSQGPDNQFVRNIAKNNGDEGIRLRDGGDGGAFNNLVIENRVENNGLSPCDFFRDNPDANPGIAVTDGASDNKIKNNKIKHNCIGIGIEKRSDDNKVIDNDVSKSKLLDMVDGNNDCGNNRWNNNEFVTSASGPFPPGRFFPRCIGRGDALRSVADQGEEAVQEADEFVQDAGESLRDAAESLFD